MSGCTASHPNHWAELPYNSATASREEYWRLATAGNVAKTEVNAVVVKKTVVVSGRTHHSSINTKFVNGKLWARHLKILVSLLLSCVTRSDATQAWKFGRAGICKSRQRMRSNYIFLCRLGLLTACGPLLEHRQRQCWQFSCYVNELILATFACLCIYCMCASQTPLDENMCVFSR